MRLDDLPPELLRVFAVLLGLLWGSFLNVVIYRVPLGLSVVRPASRCPACERPIRPADNVPVFSYLLLRGRARCCGAQVSPRYPLVEALGGFLGWAVLEGVVLPLPGSTSLALASSLFAIHFALVLGLVAAAFIDLEHMYLPDGITLGGTALGLATARMRGLSWLDAGLGAALGFGLVWLLFVVLYEKLRGHPGMGLGDAKLLALAGAWLGWTGALAVLGAAAVQGLAVTLVVLLRKGKLEEPAAVREEREAVRAELEALSPEERERVEAVLEKDPLASEPEEGLGQARIAFGPFLVLAILEGLLLGRDRALAWLGGAWF